eukprot:TRINITY_DN1429_c0_g1_i1.p1 TRINITY_DN1429_c0_g1~~TRINITY_DN1429_c0_g1_i1.p1  ORF type:complete len:618 (+),score=106.08 TRINITY_DN1429_c0_g1_i1:57-1856(+)
MANPCWRALRVGLVCAASALASTLDCEQTGECALEEGRDGVEEQALKMSLLQRPRRGEELLQQEAGSQWGSCRQYKCGSSFQHWKGCQCNKECKKYGSCCADYDELCIPTCAHLGCKARYVSYRACQCNSACVAYGNCCKDYAASCLTPTPEPTPEPTTLAPTEAPSPPTVVPTPYPTHPLPSDPEVPTWRDMKKKFVMKGIAYGPSPETVRGVLFERDDFLSEAGAPLYAQWGRGDFKTMSTLGANTVRLYGMDPTQNHTMGLDEAHKNGLSLIAGVSDWPYLQMPGSCQETGGNCYQQIFDWYMMVLDSGLTVTREDGKKAYHPALKSLIVINEPEIGKFNQDRTWQCKVVVTAIDAIVSAERVKGVFGNPLTLTVAYSMAGFYGPPALGQMQMLFDCMNHIEWKSGGYKPVNDVKQVYLSRFVNSFNTHNNAGTVTSLILDKYRHTFWSRGVTIPLMIGEYDASTEAQKWDLKKMLDQTTNSRYPFFLGYNYFEFQARYDKKEHWQHEMTFGTFGFDFECKMGNLSWWGGGANFGEGYYNGKNYTIYSLVNRNDPTGYAKAKALADAFGGDESKVDFSCRTIEKPADFKCYGCWSQ